jgi:hypothetical protein
MVQAEKKSRRCSFSAEKIEEFETQCQIQVGKSFIRNVLYGSFSSIEHDPAEISGIHSMAGLLKPNSERRHPQELSGGRMYDKLKHSIEFEGIYA